MRCWHLAGRGGDQRHAHSRSGTTEGRLDGRTFRQNRAHHGFVAPMGEVILSTVASEADPVGDAPVPRLGLQAYVDDAPPGEVATCTGIHGEAFSAACLAAGCAEGVLTVQETPEGPRFKMLSYPAEFPQGKTGTLLGSAAMQVFLGNHGPDGVVIVDPAAEPHLRRVALPFRRVDFVLDPVRPQFGYILTEDGSLHRLNLLEARIEASAKVTAPHSMDGHWNDPRPRLAMAGGRVALTDPQAGLLRLVDAGSLEQVQELPVEGTPFNLLVVEASGLSH